MLSNVHLCILIFLYHCPTSTKSETMIGNVLINRTETFQDAKRVFIDLKHDLPAGQKLAGFAMYVRPLNTQRDHYARFSIWTSLTGNIYRLKYQTAARLPKTEGVLKLHIDDIVIFGNNDYFGVTWEQDMGTITREVDAGGRLAFSNIYDNLPNTGDNITIIQQNYLNTISLAAIIDGGTSNCNTNRGVCQQLCIDLPQGFECGCNSGYILNSNKRNCGDINECNSINGGCQHTCVNYDGGYSCTCNSGYTININGRNCNDINECNTNNGGCQQICANFDGGYSCRCNSGYTPNSNGNTCDDINECNTNNGGCQHTCANFDGGYSCRCNSGYTLNSNGNTCNDINECNTNNGGCQQTCDNYDGGYSCRCNSGYTVNSNGRTCDDINECNINNGGCQHTCDNYDGGYSCRCNSGYTVNSNGRTCDVQTQGMVITGPQGPTGPRGAAGPQGPQGPPGLPPTDINDCPTAGCQHTCVNMFHGYYCTCREGYKLNNDKINCNNINECNINNGMCEHICVETVGSYSCRCNRGFKLGKNNRNCDDIDECLNQRPCNLLTCVNTMGGYRCVELKLLNDAQGLSVKNDNPSQEEVASSEAGKTVHASVLFDVEPAQSAALAASIEKPTDDQDNTKSTITTVIWLSVLSALVLLLIGFNICFCRRRRRAAHEIEHVQSRSSTSTPL